MSRVLTEQDLLDAIELMRNAKPQDKIITILDNPLFDAVMNEYKMTEAELNKEGFFRNKIIGD